MLSNHYEAENININEYDEFINYSIDACEKERFTPRRYSAIVKVEFLSENNQIIITNIKPKDESDLRLIINEIINKRPSLKYNRIIDIKIDFLSYPIKSMIAIHMLKNDVKQRIKNINHRYLQD